MISRLVLRRRQITDRLEETAVIEPVHPLEGREFDVLQASPGTAMPDELGLVQPVDRLGQRVVVGVATAAHGRCDAGIGEPIRVADRQVLRSAVAVVDEPLEVSSAVLYGLL